MQITGAAWWRFRYWIGGKKRMLSLGTYPDTTLAMARTKRDAARQLVAAGADPSETRKAEKAAQAARDQAQALIWLLPVKRQDPALCDADVELNPLPDGERDGA